MVSVCFYFQVHQPFRLGRFQIFDIGKNKTYFDTHKNLEILNKVSDKCYLPTNKVILELLNRHPDFKVSYSFSGTVLEQLEKHRPDVLSSFQGLVKTGRVELIQETYYHSLSFMFSREEFIEQVELHKQAIKAYFGKEPSIFRNTELIYNNELAKTVESLGFAGIILEGADHILGWRSPNFLYKPVGGKDIKLLLKNYRLSDDIAFRFSNKGWSDYPLNADKFARWVNEINGNGNTVNLFMDYETFGEHQWEDTGIFSFLRALPEEILKNKNNNFATPSEIIKKYPVVGELDIPHFISWADIERDTSAWTGNDMQKAAMAYIYEIEKAVKETKDAHILKDWRNLQTSDHFYYMCTKWASDGDVHKYFNPYENPYDAFINFNNIFNDLLTRVEMKNKEKVSSPLMDEVKLDFIKRGEVNEKIG